MNNKSTSMESTKIVSLCFMFFFLDGYWVGEWQIGSRKKTQRLSGSQPLVTPIPRG